MTPEILMSFANVWESKSTFTKIVNKLAPVTSVEVNGHLVRARMDKVAVEYVKKGYHLGI